MSVSSKSRTGSVRSRRDRLKTYLATGLGACGVASSAEAGVVSININSPNISGVNAGLSAGSSITITPWPIAGAGYIDIYNSYGGYWGLDGDYGGGDGELQFAINGGYASPRNFSAGSPIDNSANWTSGAPATVFRSGTYLAPAFAPNSFMGMRFTTNLGTDWYYGWVEVTWNGSDEFEILAAAYEDTLNTPILAGNTGGGGAVPEPASGAVVALLMGGTALRQWRKKRRENDAANSDSLAS
jgi:hypothetical protein